MLGGVGKPRKSRRNPEESRGTQRNPEEIGNAWNPR